MSSIRVTPIPSGGPRLQLAARIAAGVFGGYAFSWGFIALATAALFKAGMGFHDAEFLSSALGLLVLLSLFLWAVATRRSLVRVWLTLAVGGAAMAAAGSLLQAGITGGAA